MDINLLLVFRLRHGENGDIIREFAGGLLIDEDQVHVVQKRGHLLDDFEGELTPDRLRRVHSLTRSAYTSVEVLPLQGAQA